MSSDESIRIQKLASWPNQRATRQDFDSNGARFINLQWSNRAVQRFCLVQLIRLCGDVGTSQLKPGWPRWAVDAIVSEEVVCFQKRRQATTTIDGVLWSGGLQAWSSKWVVHRACLFEVRTDCAGKLGRECWWLGKWLFGPQLKFDSRNNKGFAGQSNPANLVVAVDGHVASDSWEQEADGQATCVQSHRRHPLLYRWSTIEIPPPYIRPLHQQYSL